MGQKETWKVRAPREHKFFIWLVLQDRCWTNERRHRRGISDDDKCTFCDQASETIDHLLVACVFSREIWFKALRRFGWQTLAPAQEASFVPWWLHTGKTVPKARRAAFDCIVVLVARRLWLQRNEKVFRSATPSATFILIEDDCNNWCRSKLIDRSRLSAG
jgi:hypothetical protein